MFASFVLRASRTTYRGSKGSGPGRSGKTSFRSSPASRPTEVAAVQSGQVFRRSQRGLYESAVIQTGSSIPHSFQKTLRTWKPNVQTRTFESKILDRRIQTRMTMRAVRTINKYGGLDQYLQKRDGRFLGEWGRKLRDQVATAAVAQEQAKALPLDLKTALLRRAVRSAKAPWPRAST